MNRRRTRGSGRYFAAALAVLARYFPAAVIATGSIFGNAWIVMFAAGFANHELRHLLTVPAVSYNTAFLLAALHAVMSAPPLLAWVLIERALR